MEKRVIVIDTSNEIAGDSDIPHLGIGRARRMQVPKTELQHQVMIEAVENHMPQVIIIDEIGTELEVLAARTIAEKGVQLIGTTHGKYLENLIKNPSLSDLIGGIQYVTLSDDEAKRRGTKKSILERKAYPAFEIIIQIQCEKVLPSQNEFVKNSYLADKTRLNITKRWTQFNNLQTNKLLHKLTKKLVVYSYSISNNLLKEVFSKVDVQLTLTNNLRKASLIIGLTKHLKQNPSL